ncbi:hypothetical protein [Alteribacillus sp. HJP-4]|uniref:hypothetical protein n=1 Tax=Alteribacillus sp. HJP-4 TaxID=2775394 RepID=UPI0035CCE8AE
MLLSNEDKKHLLKLLARDKHRLFHSEKERAKSKELHEKIKQTLRNENINKDHK